MSIQKGSEAQIIQAEGVRTIRVVEYQNPETVLAENLRGYLIELGYSSLYPNFQRINIGNVHPFVYLLFQSIMEQNLEMDVFPSITVADSTASQSNQILAQNEEYVSLDRAYVDRLKSKKMEKILYVSDENLAKLYTATENGGTIRGRLTQIFETHSFDFNIWSENKEVTSFLFDLVKAWLVAKLKDLHQLGFHFEGDISGGRSGDVNMDFGKILYGANVRAGATVPLTTMDIDTPWGTIETINVDEDFFYTGEDNG